VLSTLVGTSRGGCRVAPVSKSRHSSTGRYLLQWSIGPGRPREVRSVPCEPMTRSTSGSTVPADAPTRSRWRWKTPHAGGARTVQAPTVEHRCRLVEEHQPRAHHENPARAIVVPRRRTGPPPADRAPYGNVTRHQNLARMAVHLTCPRIAFVPEPSKCSRVGGTATTLPSAGSCSNPDGWMRIAVAAVSDGTREIARFLTSPCTPA
jgi:hypothetical protein